MLATRHSNATSANEQLVSVPANEAETNQAWLQRVGATEGIVLFGGSSVAHFRLRVAQSHLRSDLSPSYWSVAGILTSPSTFVSVPLELRGEASDVPRSNGVQTSELAAYDDARWFPNVGVVRFASSTGPILEMVEKVKAQRSVIDLPSLMLPWLGYVWGAGQLANPLLAGQGVPSAAFVEAVYAMAGVELTPGLASAGSCPEAIWQSVKWWHPFYAETASVGGGAHGLTTVPSGSYAVRQPAAAVVE
jgi:hypothetical protein